MPKAVSGHGAKQIVQVISQHLGNEVDSSIEYARYFFITKNNCYLSNASSIGTTLMLMKGIFTYRLEAFHLFQHACQHLQFLVSLDYI